jgi:hypothetical protein
LRWKRDQERISKARDLLLKKKSGGCDEIFFCNKNMRKRKRENQDQEYQSKRESRSKAERTSVCWWMMMEFVDSLRLCFLNFAFFEKKEEKQKAESRKQKASISFQKNGKTHVKKKVEGRS